MRLVESEIRKRLRYWRGVLGIEERWQIHVYVVPSADRMPEGCDESTEACINVTPYWSATLTINESLVGESDLDAVVVHELLHVLFRPLEILAGKAEIAEWEGEQLIERLAAGYLTLDRNARRRGTKR
jgi:hypothetical protein